MYHEPLPVQVFQQGKNSRMDITKMIFTSRLALVAIAIQITATAAAAQQANVGSATPAQEIFRAGSRPSVAAPADYFTGRVRIDPVWSANADINASGGLVTFEPGARSAWHVHPKGQYFVVTSGVGLTQEWGKQVREIHPGDVVPAGGQALARRRPNHRDDPSRCHRHGRQQER